MATHCFRPQPCKNLITIDRRTFRFWVPDAYRCATIATVTPVTSSLGRHARRFNPRTRQSSSVFRQTFLYVLSILHLTSRKITFEEKFLSGKFVFIHLFDNDCKCFNQLPKKFRRSCQNPIMHIQSQKFE